MSIKLNVEGIRIRPSAVDGFYQCSYQWAKTFLEGVTTIPGARAAIGTAIHRSAEVLWQDAMASGKKDPNISKLTDAAMQEFQEVAKEVQYDEGENENTAAVEIIKGTQAFIDDIVPFTAIPDAVEEFYKVDIGNHPIVKELGGTVDYIQGGVIADLKTSKRKATVSNYTTQQSIYRYLAEANGHKITHNLIQNVVLKKQPDGQILQIDANVPAAKMAVNRILDTLEVFVKDVVPAEVLFRGNPKYYLCSPKYCSLYKQCPFVKGEEPKQKKVKL